MNSEQGRLVWFVQDRPKDLTRVLGECLGLFGVDLFAWAGIDAVAPWESCEGEDDPGTSRQITDAEVNRGCWVEPVSDMPEISLEEPTVSDIVSLVQGSRRIIAALGASPRSADIERAIQMSVDPSVRGDASLGDGKVVIGPQDIHASTDWETERPRSFGHSQFAIELWGHRRPLRVKEYVEAVSNVAEVRKLQSDISTLLREVHVAFIWEA